MQKRSIGPKKDKPLIFLRGTLDHEPIEITNMDSTFLFNEGYFDLFGPSGHQFLIGNENIELRFGFHFNEVHEDSHKNRSSLMDDFFTYFSNNSEWNEESVAVFNIKPSGKSYSTSGLEPTKIRMTNFSVIKDKFNSNLFYDNSCYQEFNSDTDIFLIKGNIEGKINEYDYPNPKKVVPFIFEFKVFLNFCKY